MFMLCVPRAGCAAAPFIPSSVPKSRYDPSLPPLPTALQCPAHSHYSICTHSCEGSCAALFGVMGCTNRCFEGCECDDHFLLSHGTCVPVQYCGCTHNGRYLPVSRGLRWARKVEGLEGD